MFGYITIGVRDMAKAEEFYGALLSELGAKQLFGQDRIKFYGAGDGPMIAICTPFNSIAVMVIAVMVIWLPFLRMGRKV